MFQRIIAILATVGLAVSTAWAAGSPFIGTWKLDPTKSRFPDEMKVQSQGNNKFAFDFGAGTETIIVDGSDQPGYGGTLLSVKADGPGTWIVRRKQDGRLLLEATWKLSQNGAELTDAFLQFGSDSSTLSMDYVYRRAGGGSGFAADWQSVKETMNSPYPMEVREFDGDGLSFITPSSHKNVKFEGKSQANGGPDADRGAASSMRRVNERTLVVTDKTDGKVTSTREIGLSADLQTLTMTVHVPGRDRPTVLVFERT